MDLLLLQPAAVALARRDLLVLVAAAGAFLAYRVWVRVARRGAPSAAAPNVAAQRSEKTLQKDVARDRAPGGWCSTCAGSVNCGILTSRVPRPHTEWSPVAFEYPHLAQSPTHFSTLAPIPYRPFKWGEYQ